MTEEAQSKTSPTRQAARVIARNMWVREYKAENPDASTETLDAAWKELRSDRVDLVMKAVRAAERSGLKIVKDDDKKKNAKKDG